MPGIQHKITSNYQDSHQSQPWVCVTFLSFVGKDSIYHTGGEVSRNTATKIRNVTVVNDILKLQVTQSKASYMTNGEMTLASGDLNYQALLSPGDHCLVWMGDRAADFEKVSTAARSGNPANYFDSGLKFVGRVNSVRSAFNTSPDGKKTLRYMVTIKGFSELSTVVYYNPLLAPNAPTNQGNSELQKLNLIYGQISKDWNNYFFSKSKNKANVQSILSFFIDIFLGKGPRDEAKRVDKAVRSPNGAFLVPAELLSILSVKNQSAFPNYANLLHLILGVQSYGNSNSFLPDITEGSSNSVQKITPKKLHGTVTSPPDLFNNTPLWSILQQVCNPALNEIYTTLRVNEDNNVVPTFVARQIPFTSIYASNKKYNKNLSSQLAGTKFIDLPRWVIDPSMQLGSFNLGTSDAARFNFFQIYGTLFGINSSLPNFAQYAQIAKGNFQLDDIDVSRNGSRNYINTTYADFTEGGNLNINIAAWAELIKDWYGNGHLKLNGSITCAGIRAPICVGDNLQISNKLLHIEAVTHYYEVNEDSGVKTFMSSMDLSQGILADGSYAFREDTKRSGLNKDGKGLEPGFSDEERKAHQPEPQVADFVPNLFKLKV